VEVLDRSCRVPALSMVVLAALETSGCPTLWMLVVLPTSTVLGVAPGPPWRVVAVLLWIVVPTPLRTRVLAPVSMLVVPPVAIPVFASVATWWCDGRPECRAPRSRMARWPGTWQRRGDPV
jgi:hypothetical protein